VELPHNFKGTHMSRFVEILNSHDMEISVESFKDMLAEMNKRLEAERGHIEMNFPYFINGSGPKKGQVEPLIARGNSLGAASEAKFERHTRPMGNGDKLILFTDGVTDAGTPSIDPWGEKRFRASLTANADKRAIHLPEDAALTPEALEAPA